MLDLTRINLCDIWVYVSEYYLRLKSATTVIIPALAVLFAIRLYQNRQRPRTPRLQGPPSQSFLFGVSNKLFPSPDSGFVYREWERTYGPVYELPVGTGSKQVVLLDPKAIAHFFSKDTTTYSHPVEQRKFWRKMFGDNLIAMEGDTHKRQRRVLSAAFSVAAIRDLTPVFLDSAYKLKTAWDSSFQSLDSSTKGMIIDVQNWMNHVALDSIGNAGFSYDFGALKGKMSPLVAAFTSYDSAKPSLAIKFASMITSLFPILYSILPSERQITLVDLLASLKAVIAADLLDRVDKETDESNVDRSILGVMIRSENANSNTRLSTEEVTAQNMFMVVGYETTAITLTWALIELARHPEMQDTLRAELRNFFTAGEDPTYDHLMNHLPYLDAFTCEILRIRPAEPITMRIVNEDDTIPLTNPIRTASGEMIDSLFVEKGTAIRIPLAGVNISEALWGPDALTFDPNRWLVAEHDKKGRKEEVKGHRHLLTFAYGPRMCPGRNFAIMEFKTVLSVLVRNFTFEFPNGPSTKLESHIFRPKVVGEEGPKIPLLVRRLM